MFTLLRLYFVIFILLQFSCSNLRYKDPNRLKEEFDICSEWHDNMTWSEFLSIRNKLQRTELSKYVDKIEQQNIAQILGLAVPKTYLATREKKPVVPIIASLKSYVAKVTHMSLSQGLIIVENGINLLTGEPITPVEVEKHLYEYLDQKPRNIESWALYHVKPGFMIQEYITDRMEVKIQCIWGKAIIGEWRGGNSKTQTTQVWARYDRAGNNVDGTLKAPKWWLNAVLAAEKVAQKSDALRVDFLVKSEGELLLNELEIWPESNWSSMINEIEKQLNDGYRGMCEEKS